MLQAGLHRCSHSPEQAAGPERNSGGCQVVPENSRTGLERGHRGKGASWVWARMRLGGRWAGERVEVGGARAAADKLMWVRQDLELKCNAAGRLVQVQPFPGAASWAREEQRWVPARA